MGHRIYWTLVFSLFLAMTGCKDKSHNTGNGAGYWPDNPQPLVGWFALMVGDGEWAGLMSIDSQGQIKTHATLGSLAFDGGSLPSREVGWACTVDVNLARSKLYELKSDEWIYSPSQPECKNGEPVNLSGIVRFENGDGYLTVHCGEDNLLFTWKSGSWTSVATPDSAHGIKCLTMDYCIVYGNQMFYKFNGSKFENITKQDLFEEVGRVAIQNEQRLYAVVSLKENHSGDDTDSEPGPYTIQMYEDGKWRPTDQLTEEENSFSIAPLLFRIDNHHIAVSIQLTDTGGETIILSDSGEVIRPGWPEYQILAFAPSGSGLGYWRNTGTSRGMVDLIEGLEYHSIYETDPEKDIGVSMLLAADAE